jgi:hypothetical protein
MKGSTKVIDTCERVEDSLSTSIVSFCLRRLSILIDFSWSIFLDVYALLHMLPAIIVAAIAKIAKAMNDAKKSSRFVIPLVRLLLTYKRLLLKTLLIILDNARDFSVIFANVYYPFFS